MAAEPGADDESRAEVGRSLLAVGEQQEEIGKTAEAKASYEEARRNLITVADSQPGVAVYRADLATADSRLGWLYSKTGQLDERAPFAGAMSRRSFRASGCQPRRHPVPDRPGKYPQQHRLHAGADG